MKIDAGTMAIIEVTSTQAAEKAVKAHMDACPIGDLKADVYGNGKPGLKADVAALKIRASSARAWLRPIVTSVAAAVIIGVIFWCSGQLVK